MIIADLEGLFLMEMCSFWHLFRFETIKWMTTLTHIFSDHVTAHCDEEQEHSLSSEPEPCSEQTARWEEDRGAGAYEEGREVEEEQVEEQCEETPEEEEVKVEWPAGVPQASEKELVKLSHKEGVRKG